MEEKSGGDIIEKIVGGWRARGISTASAINPV
jgi:hypothetical protein